MNIITYMRVSTEEQTVEPQRLELNSWIERNAFTAVGEFTDVISGARAERPGLDALLERCRAGGVDAVVVVKLDRLGRSILNVVGLVEELSKMGVAVICTTQGIDTRNDNPCGKMILGVMAAFAAFERDIIRERTVAGLKVARANGKVLGRPSKTLVATSEHARIVGEWREGGQVGGLRALAVALGGCSPSTAGKVLRSLQAQPDNS